MLIFYIHAGNYLAEHCDEARKILTAAKIISVPWDVSKGELLCLFIIYNVLSELVVVCMCNKTSVHSFYHLKH